MKYIQELREGERLSQIFFCKNKTIATTKAGKTYYSLTLQDKTGVLDGKVWELSGAIEHFENLDFIKIDGDVTLFNGSLQLNCRRIRKAKEGEYDQKDYFPVSEKDPAVMFKELDGFIQKVKEPHLHALLLSFFGDKEFVKNFCQHSAAKSVHHGFIGGLLEHTLSVTKICDFFWEIRQLIYLSNIMEHSCGQKQITIDHWVKRAEKITNLSNRQGMLKKTTDKAMVNRLCR